MGMAAGQARLLSITSRMSDNELRAQLINNDKMRLATESSRVSEAYVAALNDAQMMFTNYDANNNKTYQQLTFNALTSYNPYNNQYALSNASGNVLISERDAANYEKSNSVDEFLACYGLEKTSMFFDDTLGKNVNKDTGTVTYPVVDRDGNPVLNEDGIQKIHDTGLTPSELKDIYFGTNGKTGMQNVQSSEEYWEFISSYDTFMSEMDEYRSYATEAMKNWINYPTIKSHDASGKNYGNLETLKGYLAKAMTGDNSAPLERYNDLIQIRDALDGFFSESNKYDPTYDGGINRNFWQMLSADGKKFVTGAMATKNKELGNFWYEDYGSIKNVNFSLQASHNAVNSVTIKLPVVENQEDGSKKIATNDRGQKLYYMTLKIQKNTVNDSNHKYNDKTEFPYELVVENGTRIGWVDSGSNNYAYTFTFSSADDTNNPIGKSKDIVVDENGDPVLVDGQPQSQETDVYGKKPTPEGTDGKTYDRFTIPKTLLDGLFAGTYNVNTSGEVNYTVDEYIQIHRNDSNPGTRYSRKPDGTYEEDPSGDYKKASPIEKTCVLSDAPYEQMASALYNLVDTISSNYDKLFSTLDPVWFERQSSDGPKTLYKRITSDAANLFSQISGDSSSSFLGPNRTTPDGITYKPLNDAYRNKADELYKSNDIVEFLDEYWAKNSLTIAKDFQKIREVLVLDRLMDAYGEPKVTYIDKYNKNEDGEAKAQWYINLYNRIKDGGYHVLKDGLAASAEWIKFAFESGTVTLEQIDDKYTWNKMIYTNSSDITEQTNNAAVAKAEAEYNAAMNKIENKDKRYDLELKNIDTEHNSLQTEYESIKKAIEQNVSRTFKIYS